MKSIRVNPRKSASIPKHVAIIPDGNRRWAKERGQAPFFGHVRGAKTMEKILKAALEKGVFAVSMWGCSVANVTKRSREEVEFLFKLFDRYFKRLAKDKTVRENEVRIEVIGRWQELFPEYVKKSINAARETTKHFKKHRLTILMAYSGTEEMVDAITTIAEKKRKQPELAINEELVKNSLWTNALPPVDLVIRTGGEPHWSQGFMMWDVAEAQLYFTKTLWPAFSEKEFEKAIEEYGETERRHGK